MKKTKLALTNIVNTVADGDTIRSELREVIKTMEDDSDDSDDDYDDEINGFMQVLTKVVPEKVDELISKMKIRLYHHHKYSRGKEYILHEVYNDHSENNADNWREHFKSLGLTVHQYSSGRVEFYIKCRPDVGVQPLSGWKDMSDVICKAINRYFDEFEMVDSLAKEMVEWDRVYGHLKDLGCYVTDNKYTVGQLIKDDDFIDLYFDLVVKYLYPLSPTIFNPMVNDIEENWNARNTTKNRPRLNELLFVGMKKCEEFSRDYFSL